MVTSKSKSQRWLHMVVGMMRGERNTCYSERNGVFNKKVDYKSQASAEKSAIKLAVKFGRPFDAYQCWFCRGWHIGGSANLTFGRFCSIVWIWIIKKKRTVRKARMKPLEKSQPMDCERCGTPTNITTMSMFNEETICMACKKAEQQRPDYKDAVAADEAAIKSGNFNFKGIGL